ncbi:MAG: 4Fe-4S dicluster domain-containing protein [Deltaproteobacteria bacterium]|nr:4Fe-4S dicluster domain-containing protein [Deltaproteobacteria bacterium]
MARWGMVIDVKRCIACWSCTISCKEEHFLPPNLFWNRLLIGEKGKFPTARKLVYPVLCNHCTEAACVEACPTGATYQKEDGIVMIDYDKCVGCRACLISCPYQQRSYYDKDTKAKEYFPGQGKTEFEKLGEEIYPFQVGTVVKCNFCEERISDGLQKGLKPGIDEDASPACVNACPVGARVFGDISDNNSAIAALIKNNSAKPLHPEFETEPAVFYID